MLSRVATALYLVGRRLERADHLARLTAVHQEMALEGSTPPAAVWDELLECAALPAESRRRAPVRLAAEIRGALETAAQAARAVRPSISSEVFEQVNRLHERAREEEKPTSHQALRSIQLGVHLVTGLVDDAMAHGPERDFLRIGRHLERVVGITRLVACKAAAGPRRSPDANDWAAVLRCAWSLEAYRVRGHRTPVDAAAATAALLYDPGLPRSARLAADRVLAICDGLGPSTGPVHRAAQRLARLYAAAGEFDPARLAALDRDATDGAAAVELALRATYFMPTRILQHLDVSDQQQ